MPPIAKKQTQNGTVALTKDAKTSVLSRIAPVKKTSVGRLKVSVYGLPKCGKTRFACTFPKPMLLIGAEDGTDSVQGVEGVDFVQLQHTQEMFDIIELLKTGKYASCAVDTATKLRDMRISEIKGLGKTVIQKSFGFAGREEWMQCSADLKEIFAALLDIPRTQDLNVVVIAQEGNRGKEDSGSEELLRPQIGGAVGKALGDFIDAECSYICQALIREQITRTIKTVGSKVVGGKTIGGRQLVVEEKTGKKEYCIRIGPHESYITGFRIGMDRTSDIPDYIVDPSYSKIVAIIKGEQIE